MTQTLTRTFLAAAAVGALSIGAAACSSDGGNDDPTEDIKDGVDDVGDELEDVGNDVGDEVEDVGDDIKDSIDE